MNGDSPRIEDLRRRVQKDPASIAFAQLAEARRRVGQYQECDRWPAPRRPGPPSPGYLSARVALLDAPRIEVDQLDEAQAELAEVVLASALQTSPRSAALAEIFLDRRGAPG